MRHVGNGRDPDGWKDFVELAKAAGTPFLTMHSWTLKREELDEMVQRLADSEFTDGDDVEDARWLRAMLQAWLLAVWAGSTRARCFCARSARNGTSATGTCSSLRRIGGLAMDEPDQDGELTLCHGKTRGQPPPAVRPNGVWPRPNSPRNHRIQSTLQDHSWSGFQENDQSSVDSLIDCLRYDQAFRGTAAPAQLQSSLRYLSAAESTTGMRRSGFSHLTRASALAALNAGLQTAVDPIDAAIDRKEPILIYGDYDVDGTMAVIILKTAIELCGGACDFHVPHRIREGYDMRGDVIERAAAAGIRLIISVDMGSAPLPQLKLAGWAA